MSVRAASILTVQEGPPMRLPSVLACSLLLSLAAPASNAAVPETMSYQGVLTDNAGTPVPNGNYDLVFGLYDVATGGAPLWTETRTGVSVQAGLVSLVLGSVSPITLPFDAPYFLGIGVNGGAEMAPRIALASSPYGLSLRLPFSGTASSAGEAFRITNTGGGAAIVSDPLLDARGSLSVTGAGSSILLLGDNVGDASVALPGDAISSLEILDEPGVASATSSTVTFFNSGYKTLLSRTITVPADGYVLAIASAGTEVFHAPNVADGDEYGISRVATSLPANQGLGSYVAASMPSNFYDIPVSPHGLFQVTAGANTFYFLGHYIRGGQTFVYDMQLTLAYFPTAYGVVTSTVAQNAAAPAPGGSLAAGATSAPWDVEAERREGEAFARGRVETELRDLRARLQALESSIHATAAKRAPATGKR
jgi:hypothetical protein